MTDGLNKVFRPAPGVRSRIHDIKGERAPMHRVAVNFPRAIAERVLLATLGRMPRRPWISYDATAVLAQMMRERPLAVLEFGSGASTLWFARRAAELHSVEHNPAWHTRVSELLNALPAERSARVEYELQPEEADYTTFRKGRVEGFDIVLVDGIWRRECVSNHLDTLRKGGVVYLDNSDADTSTNERGELEETIALLDAWAARTGRTARVFTDFAPTALHATQGRLYGAP
ncbi:hypothetical protein ATO13_21226 [Stappia sp. 22II-S9-Z10]|nr:hypothetical protein ATO13_21226 [Stappia sp. 22II-S9-Z10]